MISIRNMFGLNAEEEATLEQYKLLWELLSGEMGRFWIRFNVLTSIQVVSSIAIIGIGKEILLENIAGLLVIMCGMTAISALTILIVFREITLYKIILSRIDEFEKKSVSKKLGLKLTGNENIRNPFSFHYALIISVIIAFLWGISILGICNYWI